MDKRSINRDGETGPIAPRSNPPLEGKSETALEMLRALFLFSYYPCHLSAVATGGCGIFDSFFFLARLSPESSPQYFSVDFLEMVARR